MISTVSHSFDQTGLLANEMLTATPRLSQAASALPGDKQMSGDRLALFVADNDVAGFDAIETRGIERLADIGFGVREALEAADSVGMALEIFLGQSFAGKAEQRA